MALIALLAVIPALGLAFQSASEERGRAVRAAEGQALRLAQLTAEGLERSIEGTRQLLGVLARLPETRAQASTSCSVLFASMLDRSTGYANLGAAARDGGVYCSAVAGPAVVNVAHRHYFREALAGRDFTIGEYQVGRITGSPAINFAVPVRDDGDSVSGVVFAAFDLEALGELTASVDLPAGAATTVIDRNGTILTRSPSPELWVGRTLPDSPIVRVALGRRDGSMETRGLDGVTRFYGFKSIGPEDGGAAVAVGIPKETALGAVSDTLRRNVIVLALVAGLAVVVALGAGGAFVVAPVRAAIARERRAAERERDAAERLRGLDETKNDFIAAVAHDLRQPLGAILGLAHVLERQGARLSAADASEVASGISNSAKHVEQMLVDLLDVDRLSRGSVAPDRRPTDLAALVGGVTPHVDLGERPFVVELSEGTIDVDPGLVGRILENLLRNAADHTPADSGVWLRAWPESDGIVLAVEDAGRGVPADARSSIFELFRRGGDGRGTGIGLHLVSRFAAIHGGRAWVEDRDGGGASFRVYIPCRVTV